jgi:hypothetical protein
MDPDEKQCIKEFISVGQKKGGAWVDYNRMNPETKQFEHNTPLS